MASWQTTRSTWAAGLCTVFPAARGGSRRFTHKHRGRLFLPFADNDPKTAEVISKALLLAKDGEIKDSTILEQILMSL